MYHYLRFARPDLVRHGTSLLSWLCVISYSVGAAVVIMAISSPAYVQYLRLGNRSTVWIVPSFGHANKHTLKATIELGVNVTIGNLEVSCGDTDCHNSPTEWALTHGYSVANHLFWSHWYKYLTTGTVSWYIYEELKLWNVDIFKPQYLASNGSHRSHVICKDKYLWLMIRIGQLWWSLIFI